MKRVDPYLKWRRDDSGISGSRSKKPEAERGREVGILLVDEGPVAVVGVTVGICPPLHQRSTCRAGDGKRRAQSEKQAAHFRMVQN